MKRYLFAFLLPFVLGACLAQARESKSIGETLELEVGQVVRIDFPVAELEIEAADQTDVVIELTLRCRWSFSSCDDALEDLELVSRASTRRLTLGLAGVSRWKNSMIGVEGTIRIPQTSPLEVKMGVARIEISGVQRDLRVDLGVGDLDIRLPEASVGEAFVDVGVGQIHFFGSGNKLDGHRSFLVGNEIHWSDGAGDAAIDIEVGVGDVTVRLE